MRLMPVGMVRRSGADALDDAGVIARVELDSERFDESALEGVEAFSHVEVVFHVERAGGVGPGDDAASPRFGAFARPAQARPNRIGSSVCRVLGVEGRVLHLHGLDAAEGTPVLDLKPWIEGFGPRGRVEQPAWADEAMQGGRAGSGSVAEDAAVEIAGVRVEFGRDAEAAVRALGEMLRVHNVTAAGQFGGGSIVVLLRDRAGAVRGGATGEVYWGWLFLERLVVDAPLRGQGWGRRLLRAVEDRAVQLGAHSGMLDTFSFQAPGFYAREGWTVFGEAGPWARGHRRFFLMKRLGEQR